MNKESIYKHALLEIFGLLLSVAFLMMSCDKNNDVQSSTLISETSQIITELKFEGINSGVTLEGVSNNSKSTNRIGPDSLFLSPSPLIEYKFNIINDLEYNISYSIDEITRDTVQIDTTGARVINRDTISIETGPLWLQFDERNTVDLLVGLNASAIVDTLELEIEITVIDDVPSTSGLLFTAFGNGQDEATLATSPSVIINSNRYVVIDSVPRFNPVGSIVRYTGGIKIPSFVTKQFQITDDSILQRRFLLTMTSSSGSTITNEFAINFCTPEIWVSRQCWLSGDPDCQDLF